MNKLKQFALYYLAVIIGLALATVIIAIVAF